VQHERPIEGRETMTATLDSLIEDRLMLVGGKWVGAQSGRTFDVINPATGESLGTAPQADTDDVASAVRAAWDAAPAWGRVDLRDRIKLLQEIAARVHGDADRLAFLDALGSGNPITSMRREADHGAEAIEYMCALAQGMRGDAIPVDPRVLDYTVREPYGVVARIIPFNHPLQFALSKLAAPLVTGNCVVLKPSPFGCFASLALGEIFASVLPPGVVNIVTDSGAEAGRALVQHPSIKRVAFTGSATTAQNIMRDGAAGGIKQFSFELGGKNPLIAYPDADISAVADAAVACMNLTVTLGQSCGSTSRAFIHKSRYGEFIDRVQAQFEALRPGLPTEYSTQLGTLASAAQFERVNRYVNAAKQEGARLVTGGGRPTGETFERGYFFQPTLFADVQQKMTIAREEVFGPVLSVLPWDDEEQMLDDANDITLGLTANIWTNDIRKAHLAARRIQAGYVWINAPTGAHFRGAPFGGYKSSGVGHEESIEEILSYTQLKNIAVWLGQ